MFDSLRSTPMIIFLILTVVVFWAAPKKFKNIILLAASYLFIIRWGGTGFDWRPLGILFLSTVVNFFCGQFIFCATNRRARKGCLSIAIFFNLILLGIFKYFNFFAGEINKFLQSVGFSSSLPVLHLLLPLGISFYTFRVLSYCIDIYLEKITPASSFIDFSVFVAYFPAFLAGPIERAGGFLAQLQDEKKISQINVKEGLYLFLYGLFQKMVIADTLAPLVNTVYSMQNSTGSEVLVATYAFALQLYGDFAGYTNMARGLSRFFGINLSQNFNLPYFAKNPSDFWRRWHITLSFWVKDYIYLQLGGKVATLFGLFPLLAAWITMGLWHGAAWNYVVWGLYWFILIYFYRIWKYLVITKQKKQELSILNETKSHHLKKIISLIIMFQVISYSWLLFRASSFSQILSFTASLFTGINLSELLKISYISVYLFVAFVFIYEFFQYSLNDEFFITKKSFYVQLLFYFALFFLYLTFKPASNILFLYSQF